MLSSAFKTGKSDIREIPFSKLKVRSRHKIKVTQLRDEKIFSFVGILLDPSVRIKLEKLQIDLDTFYMEVTIRID